MKLGVNGWRMQGQRTGIGRYLSNVIRYWTDDAVAGRFDEINFYTPTAVDRSDVHLPDAVTERIVSPAWRMLLWENLRLAPTANDDVLFCPSYTRPLLARGRTVVTTHDATIHMYPELYPFKGRAAYDRLYGWSARRATLVITTSETVRLDVVQCYGVSPSKIRVVPLAVADSFKPRPGHPGVDEVRERYLGSAAPFFLFVGKLTTRRNVPKLVEAFAEMKRRSAPPHKLLVIGLNTTGVDLAASAAALGVSSDVVHREYVSDDDLGLLYNAAEALIIPATFETLSFPVMEAQASGTPVITIDTLGMRETAGGAALLLPKAEIPEMVDAMERIVADTALRRELIERGLAHAKRFSWQRCSADTLAVLEEAASLPRRSRAGHGAETTQDD